jgi:hypothetical protein
MLRGTLRATVALLCGALISLAAPASAVAHGHTHAELLEHAADDHGDATHVDGPAIGETGHHDAHAHPTVDKSVSSRALQLLPALVPRAEMPELTSYDTDVAVPAPAPCESPPDPHDKSPANLRAPPVLSAF